MDDEAESSTVPIGGRRWSMDDSTQPVSGDQELEHGDFLQVLTCAADLYSQRDVHEMRALDSSAYKSQAILGKGSLGQVARVNADVSQPSTTHSNRVNNMVVAYAAKGYEDGLWCRDGTARNATEARRFIMELRVLSHPAVRGSENIVTILGLNWALDEATNAPKPIMMLERAGSNLLEFFSWFSSPPFSTKQQLALDIAVGLSALHGCGFIHGDLKLENVLIFEVGGRYQAKIADFSHALVDTGSVQSLPGKSEAYAAPEYWKSQTTGQLKLTDVYSYGLVFACLMAWKNIFVDTSVFGTPAELQRLKAEDAMLDYLRDVVFLLNNSNVEDLPTLYEILSSTVQRDPEKRDLNRVVGKLLSQTHPRAGSRERAIFIDRSISTSNELRIPYQALSQLPRWVHRHVVRALEQVANDEHDSRATSAAFELAVCYSSGFGLRHETHFDDDKTQTESLRWLWRAAKHGDQKARLALIPVYEAFGRQPPADLPIEQWLREMAEIEGNAMAITQLSQLNPLLHRQILERNRRTYCGTSGIIFGPDFAVDLTQPLSASLNDAEDTILHCIASTGNLDLLDEVAPREAFPELLNRKNRHGDTALIQATRAGHAGMINALIDLGADAGICNSLNETALHFLVNLDDEDVDDITWRLAEAGADAQLQIIGKGSNYIHYASPQNTGTGSAALRAVYRDKPIVLRRLFDIEDSFAGRNRELRTSKADLLNLTVAALKFHHVNVLSVLGERIGMHMGDPINVAQFWHDGNPRTLLETCVFGPVSSIPTSGYDYPERFTRVARFGANFQRALGTCLDFLLRRGAMVDEKGIAMFAIAKGRRDAISHLAASAKSSYNWARLAIQPRQRDIFYNLLQASPRAQGGLSAGPDVNYPLLYLSMIISGGVDTVLMNIFLDWLERVACQGTLWVPSTLQETEELLKLTGFTQLTLLCPLLSAAFTGKTDLIDMLLTHGASLQDKAAGDQTVFQLLLNHPSMRPQQVTDVINRAISCKSPNIISFADISILLNTSVDPQTILQYECRKGLDLGNLQLGRAAGSAENCMGLESREIQEMWTHIAAANKQQQQPLTADDAIVHENLILYAALRSNLAAVRCLLDMGFHSNGTGTIPLRTDYEYCMVEFDLPLTPLDVVQWTSHISETSCPRTARDLKASNKAIADLLVERGGSHSVAYGTIYQLFVQPFLAIKDVVQGMLRYHREQFICISVLELLGCLMFIYALANISDMYQDSRVVLVPMGLMIGILVTCHLVVYIGYFAVWDHRKSARIELVYGGDLIIYLTNVIGFHDSIWRIWTRVGGFLSFHNATTEDRQELIGMLGNEDHWDTERVDEHTVSPTAGGIWRQDDQDDMNLLEEPV